MSAAVVLGACSSSNNIAAERVLEGGTFREGLVKLTSDDPAKAQTVSERVVAGELYDGLTRWNPSTNAAEPSLASKWSVSDDQLHWTFTLADAKAANGEAITAVDVKHTFEHLARKSTGSSLAETLSPIAGYADFTSVADGEDFKGIVAVDDRTVRVDLTSPFGDLPALLSNQAFGIVHNSSVSTGPFVVANKQVDTWTLQKVAGAKTHLDTVNVSFYNDARASFAAFKDGKLDWTPVASADAKAAGDQYGTDLFKPSLRTVSLSFNLANPKFSDIRFREAIVRAIERTAVATKLDVDATVLNGVVPSGVMGEQAGGCASQCFHDRKEATALVHEVFPNGAPPITIDIASGSPFTDAATKEIVDGLSQAGITATIRSTASDQFGSVTVKPDREIFQTSWSAAYPTAGAFLDPLYRSTSTSNVSGLKNTDVDTDLNKAFAATSFNDRLNAYRDTETAVMKQLPVLPIASFPVDSVKSNRMRGISITPMGTFDIANVWAAAPLL